jgi:hypothetical protein
LFITIPNFVDSVVRYSKTGVLEGCFTVKEIGMDTIHCRGIDWPKVLAAASISWCEGGPPTT